MDERHAQTIVHQRGPSSFVGRTRPKQVADFYFRHYHQFIAQQPETATDLIVVAAQLTHSRDEAPRSHNRLPPHGQKTTRQHRHGTWIFTRPASPLRSEIGPGQVEAEAPSLGLRQAI